MTAELAVIGRDWRYQIRASSLENPQTPLSYPAEWLLDVFNGGRTDAGIRVSELTAFQCSTFLAGVDFIAGKIASFPFHVFERTVMERGRAVHRLAYEHNYYDLIYTAPNDEMTRQTFLKAFLLHALAWPSAYAEIQRDAANQAVAFWPRNPAKTRPRRLTSAIHLEPAPWRPFAVNLRAGTMVFATTDGTDDLDRSELDGKGSQPERIIPMEDMLHVPGISFDGRMGMGVVWLARQLIGLTLAMERFGAKYFANFARPGGVLEIPSAYGLPGDPRYEKIKTSWRESQGGENAQGAAALPSGFKWIPMANNAQEAQSVETRAFLRTEIAALLHLPPRVLGDQAKSSRASTEQENQEILDFALQPWMSAIELEWKRKVFPHRGIGRTPQNRFYVGFDDTGFRRGDAASREKFYASGKQWGYLNTNDIHSFEGLNPVAEEWAEEYWMPVNMTLATTPIDPTHQDGAGQGEVPASRAATAVYAPLFRDALGRVLARERRDLHAYTSAFSPVLHAIRDSFREAARQEMRLGPGEAVVDSSETDRFVASYLAAMEQRGAEWLPEQADALAGPELERAARAIRMAAYREVAAAKAKEPVVIR